MTEEEIREMARSNYAAQLAGLGYGPDGMALVKNDATGWISVKDRLPEIGAKCLVYADGKMTVAKHIAHNEWITGIFFPVPTHWMPLPEPPKEG